MNTYKVENYLIEKEGQQSGRKDKIPVKNLKPSGVSRFCVAWKN
jgi:hypothetical protein